MDLAPGTMVTTNVRLVEPIAQGGMGSVWLADHLGLDARVAVKFIASELVGKEPTLRERFKREASISARLRSVHVVQTFDHGLMTDGTPYIVMELLRGSTFTDVVENKGRLSPRQVGVIVAQVGKVLHRAHEIGIAHRDIKPDNIFIVDDDYELFVKVLDFGIAKTTQSKGDVVTKTGAIVGSPEFMSPEQAINSKEVDHRTDLYSLAVVAYYGLTGELPFDEDEARPFWVQLTKGEHVPATQRVANLPPALDDWFARALAPRPGDRFQTARELSDALGQLVDRRGAGNVASLSTAESRDLPEHLQQDFFGDEQMTVRIRAAKIAAPPESESTATRRHPPPPPRRAPMASAPPASGPPASAPTLGHPPMRAPQPSAPPSSRPLSTPSVRPPLMSQPESSPATTRRRMASVPDGLTPAMRAELGSAPTLTALPSAPASDPEPQRRDNNGNQLRGEEPATELIPIDPSLLDYGSGAHEAPRPAVPWSELDAAPKRPTWLVVVLSLSAIIVVALVLLLLGRS